MSKFSELFPSTGGNGGGSGITYRDWDPTPITGNPEEVFIRNAVNITVIPGLLDVINTDANVPVALDLTLSKPYGAIQFRIGSLFSDDSAGFMGIGFYDSAYLPSEFLQEFNTQTFTKGGFIFSFSKIADSTQAFVSSIYYIGNNNTSVSLNISSLNYGTIKVDLNDDVVISLNSNRKTATFYNLTTLTKVDFDIYTDTMTPPELIRPALFVYEPVLASEGDSIITFEPNVDQSVLDLINSQSFLSYTPEVQATLPLGLTVGNFVKITGEGTYNGAYYVNGDLLEVKSISPVVFRNLTTSETLSNNKLIVQKPKLAVYENTYGEFKAETAINMSITGSTVTLNYDVGSDIEGLTFPGIVFFKETQDFGFFKITWPSYSCKYVYLILGDKGLTELEVYNYFKSGIVPNHNGYVIRLETNSPTNGLGKQFSIIAFANNGVLINNKIIYNAIGSQMYSTDVGDTIIFGINKTRTKFAFLDETRFNIGDILLLDDAIYDLPTKVSTLNQQKHFGRLMITSGSDNFHSYTGILSDKKLSTKLIYIKNDVNGTDILNVNPFGYPNGFLDNFSTHSEFMPTLQTSGTSIHTPILLDVTDTNQGSYVFNILTTESNDGWSTVSDGNYLSKTYGFILPSEPTETAFYIGFLAMSTLPVNILLSDMISASEFHGIVYDPSTQQIDIYTPDNQVHNLFNLVTIMGGITSTDVTKLSVTIDSITSYITIGLEINDLWLDLRDYLPNRVDSFKLRSTFDNDFSGSQRLIPMVGGLSSNGFSTISLANFDTATRNPFVLFNSSLDETNDIVDFFTLDPTNLPNGALLKLPSPDRPFKIKQAYNGDILNGVVVEPGSLVVLTKNNNLGWALLPLSPLPNTPENNLINPLLQAAVLLGVNFPDLVYHCKKDQVLFNTRKLNIGFGFATAGNGTSEPISTTVVSKITSGNFYDPALTTQSMLDEFYRGIITGKTVISEAIGELGVLTQKPNTLLTINGGETYNETDYFNIGDKTIVDLNGNLTNISTSIKILNIDSIATKTELPRFTTFINGTTFGITNLLYTEYPG